MKKGIPTIAAAVIICALIVLGITLGDNSFTENQKSALKVLLIICVCSIAYCFIVGETARNFSQMDKLWSLLPIAYTWVVAAMGGMKTRLVVYAAIVTAWGIRLTFNFARKGAYKLKFWEGKEDYRWSVVRGNRIFRHNIVWILFDLFFISTYQNLLVLAICFPALASMDSTVPFGVWDAVGAALAIAFLILETVSDEYQWKFQQTKKKLRAEAGNAESLPKPYDLGFNTLGPWSRMRHPNYLGEQGIWMSLYAFAIGAGVTTHGVFHWSVTGPLLLILLFMGSSQLGETISSGKYPKYKDYIDQVFKYIPVHKFDPEK